MAKTRWGILGTGNIAGAFAEGLKHTQDAELVAVGSRSQGTAEAFARRVGATRAHASYRALAQDPEIDAVYVATPHSLHRENSLLALGAGKAVLCEKPFAVNAREAEEVVAFARAEHLFLMEAMWTRFLPSFVRLRELLETGAIGELRMLQADFGFRTTFNPRSRLFDPALGGGALLDVGVYLVSLASSLFGVPTNVSGHAHLGDSGVDEQAAFILGYARGELAVLSTAIRTATPQRAVILGTEGQIELHAPWWRSQGLTLRRKGEAEETFELPFGGNGYSYEATEVGRCLQEGRLESPLMPLDETLSVMRTLDALRAGWGLHYPGEEVGK